MVNTDKCRWGSGFHNNFFLGHMPRILNKIILFSHHCQDIVIFSILDWSKSTYNKLWGFLLHEVCQIIKNLELYENKGPFDLCYFFILEVKFFSSISLCYKSNFWLGFISIFIYIFFYIKDHLVWYRTDLHLFGISCLLHLYLYCAYLFKVKKSKWGKTCGMMEKSVLILNSF